MKKGHQKFLRIEGFFKNFFENVVWKYIFPKFLAPQYLWPKFLPPNICDPNFCPPNIYDKSTLLSATQATLSIQVTK